MIPIDFPEKSKVLQRPSSMTDDECGPLAVYEDPECRYVVSCWRPSLRERLSLVIFGKLWVSVWSGRTQPPIALKGKKTIFRKAE